MKHNLAFRSSKGAPEAIVLDNEPGSLIITAMSKRAGPEGASHRRTSELISITQGPRSPTDEDIDIRGPSLLARGADKR